MSSHTTPDSLLQLRSRIDTLDGHLLEIIEERMSIVEMIGEIKRQCNQTIVQPERWKQLLTRLIRIAKEKGLSETLVNGVFNAIHEESVNKQINMREQNEMASLCNQKKIQQINTL